MIVVVVLEDIQIESLKGLSVRYLAGAVERSFKAESALFGTFICHPKISTMNRN